MSTRSKLLAKTGDLQLPEEFGAPAGGEPPPEASTDIRSASAQFPGVVLGTTPRTGPGQMLQFRGQMLAVEGELSKLRDRLKDHEGSLPTKKLDPKSIFASQWANRHPDAFKTAEFERLKQDIALAGGNVQPICVRPLDAQPGCYEVVFGHRRHRACLELGISVLATIETSPISDLELFAAMDRENRERADLSPYEQGLMYRRALDAGLYTSNRRLAEALGVSHTWVANVLLVIDLPPPVVECFRSPLEVQHRHAKLIGAALERDRKTVLRRAEKIRQASVKLAPGSVVAALIKANSTSIETQAGEGAYPSRVLSLSGRKVATVSAAARGATSIIIEPGLLSKPRLEELGKLLLNFLTGALPTKQ